MSAHRKAARDLKSEVLGIRVSGNVVRELRRLADAESVPVSLYVRRLLMRHLQLNGLLARRRARPVP